MKHTVEVSTRNSYGGRETVATVRDIKARNEEVALEAVIGSVGLEGVTLEADTSYTLKCGDMLTTRFGDEFTGSARATDGSTFVEPSPPAQTLTPGKLPSDELTVGDILRGERKEVAAGKPTLGDHFTLSDKAFQEALKKYKDGVKNKPVCDILGITLDELEEKLDQGWELDTTSIKTIGKPEEEELVDATLTPPDLDSGDFTLIHDEIQIDLAMSDHATKALQKEQWDILRRVVKGDLIRIPLPAAVQPGTPLAHDGEKFLPWDHADATPIEDVRKTAKDMVAEGSLVIDELDMENLKNAIQGDLRPTKGFATGGIVKGPAPMFPHVPPPIYMPKPEPSDGREELRDLMAKHSLRESSRRMQMAQGAAIEFRNNPQWNTCMVGGYTWKLSRIETGAYGSNSITPTVVCLDLISTGEPGSIGMMPSNYRIQLKP